ncbi:MAG: hypothetical protein WKF97_25910 [Chitinophagaceae bacterium]
MKSILFLITLVTIASSGGYAKSPAHAVAPDTAHPISKRNGNAGWQVLDHRHSIKRLLP